MGCIVNGPGEMADADYGYVGAGRGKISLYRGKECIEKNIPEAEAVDRLLAFIEEDQQKG
jgi:(E)-4-hydroxy-3-methylbut-2-enyl-diphosphate synthase